MKLGIMQPYFLPYIGYFQLINLVDKFVVYDNLKYTKQSWINRNRILVNGKDGYITLPLKRDSDSLNINQRYISPSFSCEKLKILRRIKDSYSRAPYYADVYELLETILNFDDDNLFTFILNSLKLVCKYLEINTEFAISSSLDIDHTLKSQDKVLAICKYMNACCYINLIGGINLYSKNVFRENQINLFFLKSNSIVYSQFKNIFVPNLSILDVMMFNDKREIKTFLLNEYTLI